MFGLILFNEYCKNFQLIPLGRADWRFPYLFDACERGGEVFFLRFIPRPQRF
jgi:hypothetical protein